MSEEIKLKPCPRCGENPDEPILNEYCGDAYDPTVTIDCDCGISFYHHGISIHTAILKWNTRSNHDN